MFDKRTDRSESSSTSETTSASGDSVQAKGLKGLSYAEGAAALQPVQLHGGGGASAESVHAAASRGVQTSSGSLPHADTIQASFGKHDISPIQFHGGGEAAQSAKDMGAEAYATGNHVVSASSGLSLHTAAHEAAHYVQQKGGVQLKDGVGSVGDQYEQHADQVADAVVQGKSAEALLDKYAGSGSASVGTQRQVQRRVGFEFEGQYNVRKVTNSEEETRVLQEQTQARDNAIDLRLQQMTWKERLVYANKVLVKRHGPAGVAGAEPLIASAMQTMFKPYDQWGTLIEDTEPRVQAVIDSVTEAENDIPKPGGQNRDAIVIAMQNANEITEAPLRGSNVPKHGIIATGGSFKLEADGSPTGGSNIEFVTDPLSTAGQVSTVVGNIKAIADKFNSKKGQASIAKDEWDGTGGATVTDQMVIYPFGGELAFEPQVTGGFRLDELAHIMDYFSNSGRIALGGFMGGESKKNFKKRQTVRGDLNPNQSNVSTAVAGARTAVAGVKSSLPDSTGYKALEGLVALIGNYLLNGSQMANGANFKEIAAPMMSRTDFAHNFDQLPTGIKSYYQHNPDAFVTLCLTAVGMAGSEGTNLVANPTERGGAGARTLVQCSITRGKWLAGIAGGFDYLVNHDDEISARSTVPMAVEDESPVHKSLGALGTTTDQVGETGDEVTAIVVELRKMRQGLTANELLPLAEGAFKVFSELNAHKKRASY